jgi:hypothetical protein
MAKATVEQSGLEGWLHRLGYASARIGEALQSARDATSDAAERRAAARDERRPERKREQTGSPGEPVGSLVTTTAAGALVAQLLRPRPVHWPRAILAGTIATLVCDAETIVESRLLGRKFSTRTAARRAERETGLRVQLARYAAGIAMAGFYARYLYGRLPGPPLVQGLTYGILEAGTHAYGGPVALLNRLAPEVPIPAYTPAPVRSDEPLLQLLRRHLVFGIVLGMVYRKEL